MLLRLKLRTHVLSWLLGLSGPKQAFLTRLSRSLLLPTASDLLKDLCFLKGKGEAVLLLQTHRRNVAKGPTGSLLTSDQAEL